MATAATRQRVGQTARRGSLRGRLLLSFMIPVLLLGTGAVVLLESAAAGSDLAGFPLSLARALLAGFLLIALLTAAALAIQTGDRLTRPVAWLLHAIDAGQVRLLHPLPPAAADWEMGLLCERVRILLGQNLAGATAMEELDALRREIGAILAAAAAGVFDPGSWPRQKATHELSRLLLDSFVAERGRVRAAGEGIVRLQTVLEQDWRDETQSMEELVKRAERAFLQQTQLAVEAERLERLLHGLEREPEPWGELQGLMADLRLGVERWRREVDEELRRAGATDTGMGGRMRVWEAWVVESLQAIDESAGRARTRREAGDRRLAGGLGRVADVVSGSNQEVGALSQDVVQLQRSWNRLGERLRSLMARVEEVQNGARGVVIHRGEENGGDAGE